MFATEQEMSERFEAFLKFNFGNTYMKECAGLFGRPDFVFYTKQKNCISVISFELKLKNWKWAARQAFRYKSFSNISYVVIPDNTAKSALDNIELFKKYNIGLASFGTSSDFKILFKPDEDIPYCESLSKKILWEVKTSRKRWKNLEYTPLFA